MVDRAAGLGTGALDSPAAFLYARRLPDALLESAFQLPLSRPFAISPAAPAHE
jgi:hypothetical protein